MLELVLDIKNNRRRKSKSDQGTGYPGDESLLEEGTLTPGVKAWLRGADVAAVQLQGVSWEALIDSTKKVGSNTQIERALAERNHDHARWSGCLECLLL